MLMLGSSLVIVPTPVPLEDTTGLVVLSELTILPLFRLTLNVSSPSGIAVAIDGHHDRAGRMAAGIRNEPKRAVHRLVIPRAGGNRAGRDRRAVLGRVMHAHDLVRQPPSRAPR